MGMKKMKKFLLALLLLTSVVALAADTDFVLFSKDDFTSYNTYQDWPTAKMITLNVKGGSTVYIANYVDSFYTDIKYDLGDADYIDPYGHNVGYDMSANKYGYRYASVDGDGNTIPIGDIFYGDGSTKEISFTSPDGTKVRTTTGYLLGTFDHNAEIFLVMSPRSNLGTEETEVNSWAPVNDPNNDPSYSSYLSSRQYNTYDLTGQTRVNFGTVEYYYDDNGVKQELLVPHEFVIGYEAKADAPSGQPLPGVMVTTLLCLGTTSVASRLRKRTNK